MFKTKNKSVMVGILCIVSSILFLLGKKQANKEALDLLKNPFDQSLSDKQIRDTVVGNAFGQASKGFLVSSGVAGREGNANSFNGTAIPSSKIKITPPSPSHPPLHYVSIGRLGIEKSNAEVHKND